MASNWSSQCRGCQGSISNKSPLPLKSRRLNFIWLTVGTECAKVVKNLAPTNLHNHGRLMNIKFLNK
ncbi:hypothetical protein HKD37_14G041218 [Glycine soja]|uniref:Uncharacterized protein n=1 Tax=Glycine max TaxID=3847 RepID=K7M893_SOYBN|nr:hypothetical protein GmHk_14G042226 [Glycine max]